MLAVETAISLDKAPLQRVDQLASELHVPRSRLLARAAEELVERHENRRELSQLNVCTRSNRKPTRHGVNYAVATGPDSSSASSQGFG